MISLPDGLNCRKPRGGTFLEWRPVLSGLHVASAQLEGTSDNASLCAILAVLVLTSVGITLLDCLVELSPAPEPNVQMCLVAI